MDVAVLSMAMSNSKLSNDVGFALLKKGMDQYEEKGQQIAEMISQTSVNPYGSVNLEA